MVRATEEPLPARTSLGLTVARVVRASPRISPSAHISVPSRGAFVAGEMTPASEMVTNWVHFREATGMVVPPKGTLADES